jgi:hypothetical protein
VRHWDKVLYTGSGRQRVKNLRPVLDCIDLIVAKVEEVEIIGVDVTRDTLAYVILGDGQGRWTGVRVDYNRETYL